MDAQTTSGQMRFVVSPLQASLDFDYTLPAKHGKEQYPKLQICETD